MKHPRRLGKRGECLSCKPDFEVVVVNNKNWLFQYLLSIVKDTQAAEDLVQEVFIRAYQNYDSYQEQGRLRRWLQRIAWNAAIRYMEGENRRAEISIYTDIGSDTETVMLVDTLVSSENLEDRVEHQELVQRVMAAIRELPEPQQQVVYYRYVQDFSVRMVANITNQSVGSVKSKSHYGLTKVKQRLAQYLVEGEYVMGCRETYPFYYQYAKGKIMEEDRVKVERHVAVCETCKGIVSALTKLLSHITPAKEDEHRHVLISIPLEHQTLTYTSYDVPMYDFYERANAILAKTGGLIPEGEIWFSWGYDADSELIGVFDNEGHKIEYEHIANPHSTNKRAVYRRMPKVYPLHTMADVFLSNRKVIRSTLEDPNLMIGELRNNLGANAKSGLYLALPGNAKNTRVKKGNGVIDAGHYKFAFSERYVTEDETISLVCSYLKK